uniref:Adenosine deaminase RNA specific B2 (inactive) n=1 Tax=Poecilia reticulata TaxID=8081 RepID=A0A3P9Q7T3_POERE
DTLCVYFPTGETSLEVKENRELIGISDFFSRYQPSRNPPFLFGKGRLCFQKQTSAWTESERNAVVQLNQLRPGLRYEVVSKSGPLHAPVFSVGVEVDGFHFEGQGASKKQARSRAAELALQSFIQFPDFSQTHTVKENFDFTADSFLAEFEPLLLENCDFLHNKTAKTEMFPNVNENRKTHNFTLDLISSASPKRHLSPVAMLNELRPGLRYLCQVERVHGTPLRNFIMVVRLEGKVFEGCARSKNQAKIQAAAAALQALYSMNLEPERKLISLHGAVTLLLLQFFAESIYGLVREKYSQLSDGCSSSSHGRHKVLAGIVMTRGFDLGSAQVVSLATGTKCLDSDRLNEDGWTLRDCHAEVLSRRALVRFFYSQLELLLWSNHERTVGQDPSIFVPDKDSTHRFRLQEGIRFHMYVSLSPCGDARLNFMSAVDENIFRRFRCHLRMKVNGGEGTLPLVSTRTNQKWAGVSLDQHVSMASMSCTDKIAKWSVVGLQGALLSHLVEPIYLHSLTVGRLSHTGHLGRAVTRRLARVKHLPSLYRRQQLLLGLSSREVCPAGRAGDVCVNWSFGEQTLEEINISTGRSKDSGSASRICRRFLFNCWLRLENKVITETTAVSLNEHLSDMAARRYQRAMQQFSNALQDAGLGLWPRKPQKVGYVSVNV